MNIKVIEQNSRVYWDLFIFLIIAIAAFEIPYELLLDFKDPNLKIFFDYLFFIAFSIDILLNCITVQSVTGNGYFGIRNLFPQNYFNSSCEIDPSINKQVVRQFPKTMSAYLTSWWFIVDFLAVFPFELLLSAFSGLNMARTLRLARLPRIIRAIRAIRAVKAIKAFNSVDNAFHLNPSLGRFILLCVIVPWLMHLFACLISYFESSQQGVNYTYTQALEQLFITFTTNNMVEVNTMGGQVTSIFAVLTGYIFFGLLMGNFATLFNQIDTRKAILEHRINKWKSCFKQHPEIFPRNIQVKILMAEKGSVHKEAHVQLKEQAMTINDANLRHEVMSSIDALSEPKKFNT